MALRSIAFFNNKGGVGKTTLTCNVASYLNLNMGKRVLLIDADPQCNATQAILSDEICEELYLGASPPTKTLFDYMAPIEAGEPAIQGPISPYLGTKNTFGTDLIPGHPKMALVEDKLSSAWNELQAGTPSGYRISNWCSQLFESIRDRYDFVLFDVGPSLGALNRTVILSSDYVVTPFGCDIFSLLGIQNISSWIRGWKKQYDRGLAHAREDRPDILTSYPLVTDTEQRFRFAGYSVQQYVTKTFSTGKRPVRAYEKIMKRIPSTVEKNLDYLKPEALSADDLSLGHIPFLYSLVPLAQANRVPIHKLDQSGRLVGSQYKQVEAYRALMAQFCEKLLNNIGPTE